MEITKSTRHQGIIGRFGEMLICNWLSRSGFEVTVVDHTGIDIIAYNPGTKERLGISVKSRTRNAGKEHTHVNLLSYRQGKNDRQKVLEACEAFACVPWIGVYVETASFADVYLTSLQHYDQAYRSKGRTTLDAWRMGAKQKELYAKDPMVKHIHILFKATSWW